MPSLATYPYVNRIARFMSTTERGGYVADDAVFRRFESVMPPRINGQNKSQ